MHHKLLANAKTAFARREFEKQASFCTIHLEMDTFFKNKPLI